MTQNSSILAKIGSPDGSEIIECLLQTGDGGLLFAGTTDAFGEGEDGDALLVKTDKLGNVSWARTYGDTSNDMALDAKEVDGGGYIVAGWTQSFGATDYDFWVFTTDAEGKLQWEKRYGGDGAEQAWSVDIDGEHYLVTGGTNSFGSGMSDIWTLKLDKNGAIVWQNAYGSQGDDAPPGPYEEYVARGLVDQHGHYLISGSSDAFGHGETDIWTAKLDPISGSVIWAYAYGDEDEETTWQFAESTGGGYFLSGTISFLDPYEADLWTLQIDTGGSIMWQKAYGVPGVWDEALYAAPSPDGGVLLGSYIEESDSKWIASLLSIDAGGTLSAKRILTLSSNKGNSSFIELKF